MRLGVEISRRLVFVNSASMVVRRVLSLGILLWVQHFLALRIAPAELELYPVLMAAMVFVPVLTALLTTGLARYVTEAYARSDARRIGELVSTMFPLLLGAGAALLVLGGLAAWNVSRVLDIDPRWRDDARIMTALLFASAATQVAFTPFGMGFYLRQRFVARNALGLGSELLRAGLLVSLLLVLGPRVLWVVVANTFGALLEFGLVTFFSRRLVPALRFRRQLFRPDLIRTLVSFGGWTVLSRLAAMIRESADPILLNKLATSVDVYSFHVGRLLDLNFRRMLLGATSAAQPALTAMFATGQDERLRRTYVQLSRMLLWGLLLGSVPLFVFRREFFRLFLEDKATLYGDAVLVTALMASRALVLFPNSAMGMIAGAKVQVRPFAIRALVIEIANLALTLYLVGVRGMGAIGCALATTVVSFVGYPLAFWSFGLKITGLRLESWLRGTFARGLVPALAAAPVWVGLRFLVPASSWTRLGAEVAAGGAVYAVTLIAFCLDGEERRRLGDFVLRR